MQDRALGRNASRACAVAILVLGVASVTDVAQVGSGRHLEKPVASDLSYAVWPGVDAEAAPAYNRIDQLPPAEARKASSGEKINLWISPEYSFDETTIEGWVSFIDSLLHGDELDDVLVYLLTPAEIAEFCGPSASACYLPTVPLMIIAPGEDLDNGLTAEAILAHEYGHHVANSRPNPPWGALFYGTKRWASYVDVCAAVLAGQFFPGDGYEHYDLNPAEGFAEAYRVTNQRRLGMVEAPWRIVDERFYPDATASALIERDVLEPWSAPTTLTYRGRFTRRGPSRIGFDVVTDLDGVATASVRASKGAKVRVSATLSTVCGERMTSFTVRRVKGFGPFTLTVSRP